jgi:hypothetical protein
VADGATNHREPVHQSSADRITVGRGGFRKAYERAPSSATTSNRGT